MPYSMHSSFLVYFLLWYIVHLLEVFENEWMGRKFLRPCIFENVFILSSCLIDSFAEY